MPSYEFTGLFANKNRHLNNFVQVAFFDEQDVGNEFSWPLDTLNHRFIDLKKVAF
jgi:hypothetical protein